jgi:hypothetical protein
MAEYDPETYDPDDYDSPMEDPLGRKSEPFGEYKRKDACNAEYPDGDYCHITDIADNGRCKKHGGAVPKGDEIDIDYTEGLDGHRDDNYGLNIASSVTHGLTAGTKAWFQAADDAYVEYYQAQINSLTEQFQEIHERDPRSHEIDDLETVAFHKAKLKMGREYQAKNAVDEELPLTEKRLQDVGGQPMEVELPSKLNKQIKDIRRENRLLLKDMDMFADASAGVEEEQEEINISEEWQKGIQEESD